ncbi:isochorismate synthase [Halorubellus sp. JP-L1]|uniref:isochorismate synthase n=1 Tax=Halorubellus sp. JP-L1 TaxID=2715753 RepID=UPI00140C0E5B|nr:isochorismate synthase [Halorubellus sp. JP-L1]NHN40449.1 isochorismate synthase [Halorubellus sp. JP-L1]
MERAGSGGRSSEVGRDAGRLVSRSREVGDVSFRAFLASRAPPRLQWASPGGLELAGAGVAVELTADGPGRFDAVRNRADAVFADVDANGAAEGAPRPRFVGGFAFRDDHVPDGSWSGFPAASFVLPAIQLTRTDDGTWVTVNRYGPDADADAVEAALDEAVDAVAALPKMRPVGDAPGVAATRRTTSKDAWTTQVADATERIRAGDLEKVVLATALEVDLRGDVDLPDVLERLRRTYPNCYRFLVQPTETGGFLGAPPERLVAQTGRRVETEALAGSVGRGGTPEADAELAQSLVDSEKIQHEQRLVVDAICEQLAGFGAVAEGEQRVRKLDNIQHLQTPISAELDVDAHVLDIVEALHPTPAVGGLPPAAAAATIRDVETFERGWYAAPVGWFDATGDGEFLVAIRSGVAGGDRATLFAGNGIVRDSDPQEEWDEIQLKYRPLLEEFR